MDTKMSEGIYVGMGGWELVPFQGIFYPTRQSKGFRKLEYYSRFFDLVEINATFYNSALSPQRAKQWLKDVSANQKFIFTTKLFRGFTHTFDATEKDALAIHKLLEPLREANKFGGILAQFPSAFKKSPSRQSYLSKIKSMFPEDPLFFDLRHKSWDNEDFYNFCRDNNLYLVNVDLPPLPKHIKFNSFAWNGIAYFRMMGRNVEAWDDPRNRDRYLYKYSAEEIKDLIERIRNSNASRTYVVFHNDRQAFSLLNGYQVMHELDPSKELNAPLGLLNAFQQLKEFCNAPLDNGDLFYPQIKTRPKTVKMIKRKRKDKNL